MDKYYSIPKPSKALYRKVYATIPVVYDDSPSLFWGGVITLLLSVLVPSVAMADVISTADVGTILSIVEMEIGGYNE